MVALEVEHGQLTGDAKVGAGVDVIAYDAPSGHLYVPGADAATLTVLAVGVHGDLQPLGAVPTAPDAHCVTTDGRGNVYLCDPQHGRLLVFRDTFTTSK